MNFSRVVNFLNRTGTEFHLNESISDLISFKVGGNAILSVYPESIDKFCRLLALLKEENIKFYVLGNGTNTYFSDNFYQGIIVVTKKMKKLSCHDSFLIAECGASLNQVANLALINSLAGLEFAYGIPGSVGGGVYMNAQAFGSKLGDLIYSSYIFDLDRKTIRCIEHSEHLFAEKSSVFMKYNNLFLLKTTFKLEKFYYDKIKAKMDDNLDKRKISQPLNYPSAGSVFKRPLNNFASKLIDDCGLKGYSIGGAQISDKHAGFIINKENATANDIRELTEYIKKVVYKKHGIMLEEEIIYVE